MKKIKIDKKIIVVVLLLFIFLVLGVFGLSYAYFNTTVIGSGSPNVLVSGDLALDFEDNTSVSLAGVFPGDSFTKNFTVTNSNRIKTYYKINWDTYSNTFINDEIHISITCTSYTKYGTGEQAVSGTCEGKTDQPITSDIINSHIAIDSGITHLYSVTITFIQLDASQNYNIGKTFSGRLKVEGDYPAWYQLCTAESTDLKCKMIADSTTYADNASSTYVTGGSGIDFSAVSSDTNGKGLYYTVDKTKTEGGERVYYYRGALTNNYLIFGGYCFRVVRTTEDGSIRLRYDGLPNAGSCPQTGADVSITDAAYNKSFNDNAYAGYMYGASSSGTYAATHTNTTDSNIKKVLDAWYIGGTTSGGECNSVNCDFTSLATKLTNYSNSIADTPYCNDRSIGTSGTVGGTAFTSLGYAQNNTLFGSIRRIGTSGGAGTSFTSANASPSFKCANNNDKFTLKVANGGTNGFGNNALNYPIGMLTSDEAVYAGHPYWVGNYSGYLVAQKSYWLMNSSRMDTNDMYGFLITWGGDVYNYRVDFVFSVTPAISLKSTVVVASGTGTYNNPYVIN